MAMLISNIILPVLVLYVHVIICCGLLRCDVFYIVHVGFARVSSSFLSMAEYCSVVWVWQRLSSLLSADMWGSTALEPF